MRGPFLFWINFIEQRNYFLTCNEKVQQRENIYQKSIFIESIINYFYWKKNNLVNIFDN